MEKINKKKKGKKESGSTITEWKRNNLYEILEECLINYKKPNRKAIFDETKKKMSPKL
jgi:hypothetical protein